MLLVISLGLLGLAAWLAPDPAGMGTHRQLGLPPCSMVAATGYPCPTCGMTTAFSHTIRGQWISAFRAQPAGWLLALATGVTAVLSLVTLISGKVVLINWYRVSPMRWAIVFVLLVLGGWGFKIAVGLLNGTLPVR